MLAIKHNNNEDWTALAKLFDGLFLSSENTRLIRGDNEPVYLPADKNVEFNQIVFAHGFFSSALHEIAHWCVAGAVRRKQLDYGYWYEPDGRTKQQQQEFEMVEVKPQALEWVFSVACGRQFSVSLDNLSGEETDSSRFKTSVHKQVLKYINNKLPRRAMLFANKLSVFYGCGNILKPECFKLENLK